MKKFYRYHFIEYAAHDIDGELVAPSLPNPALTLTTFELYKETPKGYWIKLEGFRGQDWKKWVSKTAKKRYAYPTREEALTNLIKRTEKRIKILKRQVTFSNLGLGLAESHLKKLNNNGV